MIFFKISVIFIDHKALDFCLGKQVFKGIVSSKDENLREEE